LFQPQENTWPSSSKISERQKKKKKKKGVRAHVSEITNKLVLIDNAWIQLQTIAYTSFIVAPSWKSISDKGFPHFK
jgi:hypothetical protein